MNNAISTTAECFSNAATHGVVHSCMDDAVVIPHFVRPVRISTAG
ncbi:hypothetical protein [Xanthomonas campestris]|uniref:Uncharacterized protein n=1 Tax=Xanthomonas campestris pv. papavericola TaxID=487881 RepID=A0AAJ3CD13_XANCA|nr:hypothetical protein [Xanthomonas campestris]MEC3886670.1 hypothetical protein [Xanthomonas campestris pv. papavericola]